MQIAEDLCGTFYCIVDEKKFQGIALMCTPHVAFYKLDQKSCCTTNSGPLKGFLVWKIIVPKVSLIIYFQERQKLIAFVNNEAWIIDIYSGTIELTLQYNEKVYAEYVPVCVLQDCIQNRHHHNAVPYAEHSIVIINPTQLCSFKWKDKLEIKVFPWNYGYLYSFLFYRGKLWTGEYVNRKRINVFNVDMESLTITKIAHHDKVSVYDLVQTDEGILAIASNDLLNFQGEQIRAIDLPWIHHRVICWKNKIVCTSGPDLFNAYEHDDENKSLFVVDPITGNAFKSAWKKSLQCSLFIWKHMVCILDSGSIQYRIGKSTIPSSLIIQATTPWICKRLLWIGHMKHSPSDCVLASIPRDIIQEIQSHLSMDLSPSTCNWPEVEEFNINT